MSAYIKLMTPMTDEDCLLAALADLGFEHSKVERHQAPVALVGYEGARREQKADIVIRRQHVGASSNDIGFVATAHGYQAIVSDFDQRSYGPAWLRRLGERYQVHADAKRERAAAEERRRLEEERVRLVEAQRQAVLDRARKLGYQIKESREGDSIRLVLVKRTY